MLMRGGGREGGVLVVLVDGHPGVPDGARVHGGRGREGREGRRRELQRQPVLVQHGAVALNLMWLLLLVREEHRD